MLWILWCCTKTAEVLLGISAAAGSWLHFSLAITCDYSEHLRKEKHSQWLADVDTRSNLLFSVW